MNRERIAKELVTIAKSLTSGEKFTVRVGRYPSGGVHWITMYSPAKSDTISGSEFQGVSRSAERILKAVAREFDLDKWERVSTNLHIKSGEFVVDATITDREKRTDPEELVFAFEEQMGIKSAWVG